MSDGKIQCAEYNDTFVLKCVGDVRLTFCSALNEKIEKILKEHIKKEEEIILKYLLFIAPFHDKYIGFVNMPEHIPLSETNEYNAQKVEEVIKDQSIDLR